MTPDKPPSSTPTMATTAPTGRNKTVKRTSTARRVSARPASPSRRAAAATRGRQMALPLGPAQRIQQETELRRRIAAQLDGRLELTLTDNRSVMLTVRRDARHRRYDVRLHHMFSGAPHEVIGALARYIARDDPAASKLLGRYIDANEARIDDGPVSERRPVIRTTGEIYDLQQIFDRLDAHYFGGRVDAQITWGRNAARGRSRRSIRLGSYCLEEKLIRIHPGLDNPRIPGFYVEWVVYHEMLHAVHPIPVINGRRRFHTDAFRADEQRFEHYRWAEAWERRNIALLLRI